MYSNSSSAKSLPSKPPSWSSLSPRRNSQHFSDAPVLKCLQANFLLFLQRPGFHTLLVATPNTFKSTAIADQLRPPFYQSLTTAAISICSKLSVPPRSRIGLHPLCLCFRRCSINLHCLTLLQHFRRDSQALVIPPVTWLMRRCRWRTWDSDGLPTQFQLQEYTAICFPVENSQLKRSRVDYFDCLQ